MSVGEGGFNGNMRYFIIFFNNFPTEQSARDVDDDAEAVGELVSRGLLVGLYQLVEVLGDQLETVNVVVGVGGGGVLNMR